MKATKILGQTLIGVMTQQRPTPIGNCFLVEADDGESYRIVNLYLENLEDLLKRDVITWPIEIQETDKDGRAIIRDSRIPQEWYWDFYCRICYGERNERTSTDN